MIKITKPCPFCKKQKDLKIEEECKNCDYYKIEGIYFVYCGECGAQGPSEDSQLKAIKAWNTRED